MLRTLLLLALLARAHTHPPAKAGTEAEAAGEEEAPAPPPAPPVWFLTTVPSRFISRAPTRSPKAVQVAGALVDIHTNFIPQNVWEQERQPYPPLTLPPAPDSFHAFVMPEPRPAFGGPGTLAPGDAYEPHTPFPYFTGQRTPRGRYASVADQMRRRGRLFDTSDDAPIAPYDQFRSPFNTRLRPEPNMHAIVHMDADALRTSAAARYHRHVVYVHGEAPPQGGHRMWSVTTIGDHTEALYNIVARGNLFPGHALTVANPHLTNWWRLDRLDRLYSYLEIERPPAEHSVLYDGHIPVYTAALRLCRLLTADGEWRLAAVQQLVWVNPLDIMLDPTGRRGLGFWALYRAPSGYEGFFLPARSLTVHAMQPFQLHRTQPTRAGGTDLARRLVAHARPGPYELDYWLLVRMLNRLENLAYVRHNERLIGTETVYRSVDGARGLVDFGHATLTMNGDPFRDTLAAWRDADFGRHAAALLRDRFAAVAQSIIAFYTNLRLPDFDRFDEEGRPMPPTMALRYGSTLAAWEALQLQARGNQQKWKRNLYAAVQRDGNNPTWTEAEWNGRAAIGPPEAPFLDYAPTPQPDRPQAFTAAWRAGDTQPDIPEGMLDRLAASPQDAHQLSRDRRAVPGWDVEESELRVYGHEDGGNCWFAVPCEHCANSSIYAGRGGGARANSVVLRTVSSTVEFRAAAASGGGGAVQIDTTGVQEEGFEGLEDLFQ